MRTLFKAIIRGAAAVGGDTRKTGEPGCSHDEPRIL
jgi:hypothetical protein